MKNIWRGGSNFQWFALRFPEIQAAHIHHIMITFAESQHMLPQKYMSCHNKNHGLWL